MIIVDTAPPDRVHRIRGATSRRILTPAPSTTLGKRSEGITLYSKYEGLSKEILGLHALPIENLIYLAKKQNCILNMPIPNSITMISSSKP